MKQLNCKDMMRGALIIHKIENISAVQTIYETKYGVPQDASKSGI